MKKKTKLLMMLLTAVFVVALGTGTLTNGAVNKVNSSETVTAVTTDKGGAVPIDIVSGPILVDAKAQATVAINEQTGQPQVAVMPIIPAGTSIETVIYKTETPIATIAMGIVGAQPKGSGGGQYHAGKTLASAATTVTPTAATVATSSGGSSLPTENVAMASPQFFPDGSPISGSIIT